MRILLLSLAFAFAPPAFAADVPTSNQQAPQDAKAAPAAASQKADKAEKKICRREESTDSRLGGKRICLTADEWKARNSGM